MNTKRWRRINYEKDADAFIIPMLFIINIPTIIFIIIYIICRKETNINEEKISKEIRKMNIQDLD